MRKLVNADERDGTKNRAVMGESLLEDGEDLRVCDKHLQTFCSYLTEVEQILQRIDNNLY